MRSVQAIICCALILVGCSNNSLSSTKPLPSNNHSRLEVINKQKQIPHFESIESSSSEIKLIEDPYIISVNNWYSNDEILYIKTNEVGTQVIKYNIFTGKKELFYETKHSVVKIHSSPYNNYFAIESKDIYNYSIITVIDSAGELKYEYEVPADYVDLAWNPYNEEEIMFTYYLSDFTTSVEIVNLNQTNYINVLSIEPYVQWFNGNTVAYFNWEGGQSLTAPIHLYNFETNELKNLAPKALLFTSINGYFMYLEEKEEELVFNFLQSSTLQRQSAFAIPILNSHAGYIWSPFFEWVEKTNTFYTFEPNKSGSILDYDSGFDLIAVDVKSGEKQIIISQDKLTKINCSADGELCLIGDQFEKVINTKTREVTPIIPAS